MSVLINLQKWYRSQCDGDWEHSYGIKINTLDNPGWSVFIDLEDTDLENKSFQILEDLEPELEWIKCWIEDKQFHGVGGPNKLEEIIQVFLTWASS